MVASVRYGAAARRDSSPRTVEPVARPRGPIALTCVRMRSALRPGACAGVTNFARRLHTVTHPRQWSRQLVAGERWHVRPTSGTGRPSVTSRGKGGDQRTAEQTGVIVPYPFGDCYSRG